MPLDNEMSHEDAKEVGDEQASPFGQEVDSEKYYKKFDFFYRRTAFRSMTEYYKGLFKPVLDKWREGERKSTKNFVQQFICKNANLMGFKQSKSSDLKKMQSLINNADSNAEFVAFRDNLGDKMQKALEETFSAYDNGELATTGQGPISDADKQTLKYNLRKQDLFE